MKKIHALGVGHATPEYIEFAQQCGYSVAALWHYAPGRTGERICGAEIRGSFDDLLSLPTLEGMDFLLTMGDNRIRSELIGKILAKGGRVPTLIHPTSIISTSASISPVGVLILPFCFIRPATKICRGTIVESHCSIGHDVSIGTGCFLASGAIVGAYARVGERVLWGMGAISISGKANVGDDAVIGAGAVLTRDVAPRTTVAGNPARPIDRQ